MTAFLLLTDRRWRKGLSQLVRQIEESGCLDDDDLDELARLFMTADKALFWAVPEEWFGELEGEGARQSVEEEPARAAREVDALIERTGEVDARAAAGIMAGLLDRIGCLDALSRDRLIDHAVSWPDHGVRRAGIELVARRESAEAAYHLAVADQNARIRDWAPALLANENPDGAGPADEPSPSARGDDQQSLF